ncbi:MAG: hypothetical protein U0V74_01325 [Chitinophagales bacterium]
MSKGRFFLIAVGIVLLIAAGFFTGLFKGVNLVRQGLIDNYPTVRNVLSGSYIEVDSVEEVLLTKNEAPELVELLKGSNTGDTLHVTVPYYGRYGVDMNRFIRVVRDGEDAEVSVAKMVMTYCEIKFQDITVNGQSAASVIKEGNYPLLRSKLYEYMLPVLSKNKSHIAKAKLNAAKALVFYFEPYKFHLHFFVDNQLQPVPVVPGANKDVDEYIHEVFEKK